MEGLDAASLIAEISIAITGFASIFVALGSKDGGFPPEDHIVIKSLVGIGLACSAGGITPIVVAQFTAESSKVWAVSSVVGLGLAIGLNVWLGFAARKHRQVTGETIMHSLLEVVLGLSTVVLYIINLSPLMGPPNAGFYLLPLCLALIICAKAFAQSLFRRFLI